jgi:hypothetical protein
MTEATTDFYLANFAPLEKAIAKNGRAWTQLLRQAAISRFAEPRFPTTRCVAWKHTCCAHHQDFPSARPPSCTQCAP